ncbi:MAG: selenide, water dikinase SelD [Aeromonadaceae bacterium]|nr:selenide, water dikinase SelD [Aeromonadaceae bacterium]
MTDPICLTQYSHGAGCGCKISPKILDTILQSQLPGFTDPRLIVGHQSKDDAAVVDLGDGRGLISTTDFFMPIVDDPFSFGRIAATNAISDVYAMGGTPLVAIAILGWPINQLGAEVAQAVVDGGRQACRDAGIALAGGHSIDSPEPIFGLAVNGLVQLSELKRNDTARSGDLLFLTKPLGIGILTTAQKKKLLRPEHGQIAIDAMCTLNKAGAAFAKLPSVTALTDVTGFGLAGHLLEMCEGSGLCALLDLDAVPLLPAIDEYLAAGCIPGGTQRNFASYGHKLAPLSDRQRQLLCDPQTSGGLLVAVRPEARAEFEQCAEQQGLTLAPIGQLEAGVAEPRIRLGSLA